MLSNGPLGVSAGNALSCTGCVGASALAPSAKALQPLASGESESGAFAGAGGSSTSGYIAAGMTFARPVLGGVLIAEGTTDPTDCPAAGTAAPGFLCLYSGSILQVNTTYNSGAVFPSPSSGAVVLYDINGTNSRVLGAFTVTAP